LIPLSGPQAGGTRVTFHGRNLNTGANISVLFDNVPCHVERFVCLSVLLMTTTTAVMMVNFG